jgi:hypothetical protein
MPVLRSRLAKKEDNERLTRKLSADCLLANVFFLLARLLVNSARRELRG